MITTVALVSNLLDRGRFGDSEITFLSSAASLEKFSEDAQLVIVDLTVKKAIEVLEKLPQDPTRNVFAYAGHVEEELLERANSIEGVEALPRSVFFKRLPGLLT